MADAVTTADSSSILTTIKKMLGIADDYTNFDVDIIISINSAIATLTQLGVGPVTGFSVVDKSTTWNDFIPSSANLNFAKSYIFLKVKLLFDPPLSSAVIDSINKMISELEWRIQVEADSVSTTT